jgi:thioredoxin 1
MIAPMLADVADEFASRVTVAKLDIEENPATADRYGVSSVPTMMIFLDGELMKTIVGARPRAALLRELSPFI